MSSLKQQTITGVSWTATAQAARFLSQFLLTLVLARLLTPADFGLVGMLVIWTDFLLFFGELGLGAALIQRKELHDGHSTAVFWLSAAMGLLLTLLAILLAPTAAWFYDEPRLHLLTIALAGQFIFAALQTVPRALLNRDLDFRRLALAELGGIACGGAVALVLIWAGWGVWGLVGQVLATALGTAVALWLSTPWRPQWRWRRQDVTDLWDYGSNLLGYTALSYWSRNADNLLIGKYFGANALGLYDRAYSVMLLPLSQVAHMLGRVMFPALAQIQTEKARVKQIYLQGLSFVALITFPMMLGLTVTADHFVLAFYGPQWTAVIPLLRVLSLVGLLQSLVTTSGWIYQSQGRTDWLFRWGVLQNAVFIGSFVVGTLQGTLLAVCLAYAFANLLLLYGQFAIPGRLIGLAFSEVLWEVSGILACAAGMATAVALLRFLFPLPLHWPHLLRLLLLVGFGGLIYWLLLHLGRVASYRNGIQILHEKLTRQVAHQADNS